MIHFKTALTGTLAALGLLASSLGALATPAQSTTALNVRSGPGTGFGIVDTLTPGEEVDVTECASNGWCYIQHEGPDGWVSSNYLQPISGGGSGGSGGSGSPDCDFQITIGPDGPKFELKCGDSGISVSPPAPTPPAPSGNVACFYTGPNYTGNEFCHGPATLNTLDATFNDNISSVKLYGSAKARLCVNANLGGYCRVVNNSTNLGPLIRNKASSLQVFTGAPPAPPAPPAPVTYSTGAIDLPQTYQANLDNGNVQAAGADIWYQAQNAIQKFVTPRNGAQLALGDGSNRGFAGCSVATFSSNKISIWEMPVGTYVCVRTNQGRISQFRLNGYAGTTMKLGYTTWAN